jgi:hypothetical protein
MNKGTMKNRNLAFFVIFGKKSKDFFAEKKLLDKFPLVM